MQSHLDDIVLQLLRKCCQTLAICIKVHHIETKVKKNGICLILALKLFDTLSISIVWGAIKLPENKGDNMKTETKQTTKYMGKTEDFISKHNSKCIENNAQILDIPTRELALVKSLADAEERLTEAENNYTGSDFTYRRLDAWQDRVRDLEDTLQRFRKLHK